VSRIIISGEGHTSAFWQKELADELWSNHILPSAEKKSLRIRRIEIYVQK
jgi:hypothetical protein